jgi:predicted metal-dependent hydrolase
MTSNFPKPADDTPIAYHLRRSERARRTRIVVTAAKVEVVAPLKVSERQIKAFVHAQQDWIRRTLQRVRQRAQAVESFAPEHYTDGVLIPYQGQRLPLCLKVGKARRPKVLLTPDRQLLVYLPDQLSAETSDLIRLALQQWMKQQARTEALRHIEWYAPRCRLVPRSLRIKTQKSRWGSCGPKNDINLNWLLMLAPPEVMEYVVVHELCHIRHKNHSEDFWRLVAQHMPDYLKHRKWLKQHGAGLMQGL